MCLFALRHISDDEARANYRYVGTAAPSWSPHAPNVNRVPVELSNTRPGISWRARS
jgi:hypothetical protein